MDVQSLLVSITVQKLLLFAFLIYWNEEKESVCVRIINSKQFQKSWDSFFLLCIPVIIINQSSSLFLGWCKGGDSQSRIVPTGERKWDWCGYWHRYQHRNSRGKFTPMQFWHLRLLTVLITVPLNNLQQVIDHFDCRSEWVVKNIPIHQSAAICGRQITQA